MVNVSSHPPSQTPSHHHPPHPGHPLPARHHGYRPKQVLTWVLIGSLIVMIRVFHEEMKAWAHEKAQNMGLRGLFMAVFLADGLIQPIPTDIFPFGAGFGDLPTWHVGLVAGTASTLGGLVGSLAGRVLGAWNFRRLFGRSIFKMARAAFRHYGALTIFIAAVTPLPYSATCWVGGIYRMSPLVLVLTSFLSRTGRFLLMGWLGAAV